jgi:hypothetical protein
VHRFGQTASAQFDLPGSAWQPRRGLPVPRCPHRQVAGRDTASTGRRTRSQPCLTTSLSSEYSAAQTAARRRRLLRGAALHKTPPHDNTGVEKPCVSDSHSGFYAVTFRFNRGSNDTAVRGVIGRNYNRFVAKEGVSLLLNRCKATIKVNVHDCRRIVI